MKACLPALGVMRACLISPAQQPSGPVVARKLEHKAGLLVAVSVEQKGS